VLTVDDHEAFLRVAHDVVVATPGFDPAAEFTCVSDALAAIDEIDPEMVLVDVYMPEMSGIEVARRIKRAHESTVVVLISSHDASDIPSSALASGAAAVMRKQDLAPKALAELWATHAPKP
jgi:two-component system, NarL family, invasion response regulator UvrY